MHDSIFEPKQLFKWCKCFGPLAFTLTLDLQLILSVSNDESFLCLSLKGFPSSSNSALQETSATVASIVEQIANSSVAR